MEPQSPNSSYFISTKRTRVYLSRSAEASAGRQNFGSCGERPFSWLRSSLASFTPASGSLLISRLSNSP